MLSPKNLPPLLAALAVAGLFTWLLAWHPFAPARVEEPCFLQIETATAGAGSISVSLDEGHGYALDRPPDYRAPWSGARIAAQLPPGRVRELRVDLEGVTQIALKSLRLQAGDRTLAQRPLSALIAIEGTTAQVGRDAVTLQGASGQGVGFTLGFEPPLIIPSGDEPWTLQIAGIYLSVLLVVWFALQKWPAFPLWQPRWPKLTIAVVAAASALLSTYPVVVLGKSFVSPNTIAYLLYLGEPTIPGAPQEPVEYGAGSDLGATMWQTLPYSVIESRALWHDHEFPLWNRFNSGGLSLLGQGLSMLGDPLHLIPLAAHGAWWAWDIKFVLAKVLFAIGVGLCSWSLTRRVSASALLGISAAWIGFFAYRFNHPAFFSVCYAPWVLLPWLAAREGESRRQVWLCAAGVLLANWCELTSGTAKEATMLLLSLNATGCLVLWFKTERRGASPRSVGAPADVGVRGAPAAAPEVRRGRRWHPRQRGADAAALAPLLWANALFVLLSAPAWLLFVDALRHSVTIYDAPRAYQMQPGLLIAFFDSIFSQDFTRQENFTHPSLNFLVLLGVLWALWERRGHRALLGAGAVATALVFGFIPPGWLVQLPLIGKIEHIYNVFGCVLLVLLLPVAAQGWAACLETQDLQRWRSTWWKVVFSIAGLLVTYFGFIQAQPSSPMFSYRIDSLLHSRFFASYVPCLLLAALGLPWALRWARGGQVAGAALAVVCLVTLHFRSGMFVETKFDNYVMNPRTGVELAARSPAVEAVRAALQEPARVCGFYATLSPGYQALLGLEGIAGPDALHNPWYQELCQAAGMQTAWGWRLMVAEETLPQLKRMYDVMNLRFYLRESEGPTPRLPGLTLAGSRDLEIFESKEAWPRAFFTDQCVTYRTPVEFAKLVAQGDGRPFAASQATLPLPHHSAERQVVAARDYHLTNNSTEFTVQAPGVGLVVLTETFEEGNFEVTIDGQPAQCRRVNHAFKGVMVDRAGELRIRFTYRPRLLPIALLLSLCGLVLALGTAAFCWRFNASPALALQPCET